MKNLSSITKIFSEATQLYVIDHYPFLIVDNKKYSQIEYGFKIFPYNKRIRYNKKRAAITEFIEFMWLYSDTKSIFFNIEKNCRIERNQITEEQIINIDSIKQLREITKKGIKHYYSVYFIFENFKNGDDIILYLDDVFASVYIGDIEQKKEIEIIASHCGLFIRKENETEQGDIKGSCREDN